MLVGLGLTFAATMVVAVVQLTGVRGLTWPEPESATDVDRFRVVMTSLERDLIVLFALLAGGSLLVGWALLRKRGIGPRFGLLGLNALLVCAWAGTEVLAIDRLDESDTVWGMVGSSGLATGLGYAGIAGAVVLLIVDILALTNPSNDEPVN